MLATYHLIFLIACVVLLILGSLFMFYFEKNRWSQLIAYILLGINTIVCWVTVLGFHGVEFIAIDSNNNFVTYTYPDMYGLWVFPFILFFITIAVAWVGWAKHVRKMAAMDAQPKISKPGRTNPYWR